MALRPTMLRHYEESGEWWVVPRAKPRRVQGMRQQAAVRTQVQRIDSVRLARDWIEVFGYQYGQPRTSPPEANGAYGIDTPNPVARNEMRGIGAEKPSCKRTSGSPPLKRRAVNNAPDYHGKRKGGVPGQRSSVASRTGARALAVAARRLHDLIPGVRQPAEADIQRVFTEKIERARWTPCGVARFVEECQRCNCTSVGALANEMDRWAREHPDALARGWEPPEEGDA
jgi:hypothetical protein